MRLYSIPICSTDKIRITFDGARFSGRRLDEAPVTEIDIDEIMATIELLKEQAGGNC